MRAVHETGQSPPRRLAVKNGHGPEFSSYFPLFSCSRAPARMPGNA